MGPLVVRSGARRARRVLLTGCLILAVLGLGAVEAQATTSSSLAGEFFTGQEVAGSTFTGTCNPVNSSGIFKFSVSGTAAGPFPGTFTESGSFTTARVGLPSSFSSTFTINSPAGTVSVTGAKTLAADNSHAAFCATNPAGVFVIISNVALTYTATINGAQQTTGPATVSMSGVQGTGVLGFTESFGSTSVVQKQCKHGGWKSFGTRFKNQGDCVSFFATGVKNPPSGS